jgi:hypothetical protein
MVLTQREHKNILLVYSITHVWGYFTIITAILIIIKIMKEVI